MHIFQKYRYWVYLFQIRLTCKPLPSQLLIKIQSILQDLKILVASDIYMLSSRYQYHVDLKLQQIIMKPDIPFGGVCVLLFGYPAQLPPVLGYSLWDPQKMDVDEQSKSLRGFFYSFFIPDCNYRFNRDALDPVIYTFF